MDAAGEALRALAAAVPGDPEALRAACGRVADWDSLAAEAERDGLSGILASVPPSARSQSTATAMPDMRPCGGAASARPGPRPGAGGRHGTQV